MAVDKQISDQHLSSKAATNNETRMQQPLNAVHYEPPHSNLRSTKGYNIIYLTPAQHHIYTNLRKCVISAPAGAGKTVVTLIKIVELARTLSISCAHKTRSCINSYSYRKHYPLVMLLARLFRQWTSPIT